MDDRAALFWDNIKREIKAQNTTQEWVAKKAGISFNTLQGWISKGIFPRVNAAVRIAAALDTSVEYLVTGSIQDNRQAIDVICRHLSQIQEHLEIIGVAVKKLR
jgi:transcriptional regulator with XRE-family HTH domain